MKRFLGICLLALAAFSCLSEEEDFAGFTFQQVERLITADTLKAWQIASVRTEDRLLLASGSESCLFRFRYDFTAFIANDSTTFYLRTDPERQCQADTIAFFWMPLWDEEDDDMAVELPRVVVGTDSGNIISQLTYLTASEMEWCLLEADGQTLRSPKQYVRFVRTD